MLASRFPAAHALRFLLAASCLICCVSCGGGDTTEPADDPASPGEETPATEPKNGENTDVTATENKPPTPNSVLRHTVFFSFKEESSKEDIQGVVDAFRGLPAKIPAIVDFEWGENNSPEGFNDGYTHCFVLTFKDSAGLAEYIPHPAHSGEFADVLRPHMKSAFVIDYWGTSEGTDPEKPLRHAVFFKFKKDATAEQIESVEKAFAELPSKIDAIKRFEWGKNNSPEGKDDGFTHCFMVTFDSEEGRKAYLPHEAHEEFVKLLKPYLEAPRVLDFWAAE